MWIDANILVRLLTRQPQSMFEQVCRALEVLERRGRILKVHPVHVAETLFVLEGRVYRVSPRQAVEELLELLSLKMLEIKDEGPLLEALRRYPDSGLDFPDVFLAELALAQDGAVLSFDRKIARLGVPCLDPGKLDLV